MNPRHLKASLLSALALLAALLASSCASSERMERIGWDSDSYSAPKASRISGGRFDEAVASLRTPVALQDRQVNVWPFCTVNSRYVSILWPFIDWDDFGMAIRPFYNREGNDASILFPLSSWNPVDGDGWALNAYWDPDYYGMFPLFHVGRQPDAFWFAGPFVGDGDSFGVLPLCYFGDDFNFVGPVWWEIDPPEDTSRYLGFFPLFWKYPAGSTLFPFYYLDNYDFLSPLLWLHAENGKREWTDGKYLFLGYWNKNNKEHGFFPFYNINANDDKTNWITLWWWDHNSPKCGLFPFAWFHEDGGTILPFARWKKHSATGMNGEEEKWTEGNVLLLGYWGRRAYGVFPFFRGSSAVEDMKYVGPLWWAFDEDEREYGVFPFFRVERSRGEANRSYLFPVYSWEKDRYGSEFTSIPYFREDYDYPEHRATTSVHGRRYLIYADHEKKGNRFSAESDRDDYIPSWGFSQSYLDDVKARMSEDDLTGEEAEREVRDTVASKWEVRTTALHPFFEWTSSNEGERDLRLLFYLFGFDRDRTSSSNWLLWHILFTSGSEESKDYRGFKQTSSYANVLGVFPYWFRDTEAAGDDDPAKFEFDFQAYVEDSIELLLKRALMEDGSEESEIWSWNVRTDYIGKKYMQAQPDAAVQEQVIGPFSPAPGKEKQATVVKPFKLNRIVDGIPNEEVFRVCGMDRALSGEMTAQEAEDTAKRLMDAVLKAHGRGGTDIRTSYGFFPLFGVDRKVCEKNGETTPVSTEVITPLTYTSIEKDESVTRILLGILGYSSSEEYFRLANGHAYTEDVLSTLGVIRTSTESRPHTTGPIDTLNSLAELLRAAPAADENPVLAGYWNLRVTARCDDAIELYAKFKDIVSTVTAYRDGARTPADTQAMIDDIVRWENEYFWDGDERSTSSGFYPLFFWSKDCLDRNGDLSRIARSWFVLPLLSGGSSSDDGSSLGILAPILYYGATQRHDEAIPEPHRILSPDVNPLQASHSGSPVRGGTDHYALFLVGTSDETFLQWKPGTDESVAAVYGELFRLYTTNNVSSFIAAALRRMTVAEALDIPETPYDDGLKEYKKRLRYILDILGRVGMKPIAPDAPLMETLEARLREIAAENILTRTISGFNTGWGLLSSSFSCEETGDYQTKVLFGLGANSQKLGEKEHRSILGYLYNMDTDGVNTRKFIFPFITTKDAPGFHEWSFLGGLFERSVEDGKPGGRIFFFPYGNRPGK